MDKVQQRRQQPIIDLDNRPLVLRFALPDVSGLADRLTLPSRRRPRRSRSRRSGGNKLFSEHCLDLERLPDDLRDNGFSLVNGFVYHEERHRRGDRYIAIAVFSREEGIMQDGITELTTSHLWDVGVWDNPDNISLNVHSPTPPRNANGELVVIEQALAALL